MPFKAQAKLKTWGKLHHLLIAEVTGVAEKLPDGKATGLDEICHQIQALDQASPTQILLE